MRKTWIAAGILNFITALIHTIVGHIKLIIPFVALEFITPLKAIMHACWHMVTVVLFLSSFVLLYIGARPVKYASRQIAVLLGVTYVAFGMVFVVTSICYGLFLFQSALLLPIGVLALWGAGRDSEQEGI